MSSGFTPVYSIPYPLQTDAVDVASDVEDLATAVETTLISKAPLASPALTGTPTSTTAIENTNTTQIATTAFVIGQASDESPLMNGGVSNGTSFRYSREDHVHPSDTSRLPLVGANTITTLGTVTTGTWSASTIAANKGGTGQASYAVGDILYASTSSALSKLSDVATGNTLISGGIGVAPSWGKVGLTTHVSGVLPVPNGGTGTTTSTGSGDLVLSSSPSITGVQLLEQLPSPLQGHKH